MARTNEYLLSLCLSVVACGPKAQMNGESSQLASEGSGEAHGARPGEFPEVRETPPKQTVVPSKEGEMVSAPVPVSGTFLAATILDQETVFVDSIKVGIAVYKDGMRVASQGQRFNLDIGLDETASPDVKVRKDLLSSTRAEFDREIRVYGNSIAEIKAAFPFIVIKTKVDDKITSLSSIKAASLVDLLAK